MQIKKSIKREVSQKIDSFLKQYKSHTNIYFIHQQQPTSSDIDIMTAPSAMSNTTALAISSYTRSNLTQSQHDPNPFVGKPNWASLSNDIPPASLSWKKPIPNHSFPPMYKVGVSNMTFEWTVDAKHLKVQPESLTIALVHSQKQTWTAAVVAGMATTAYWDLAHLPASSPLMVGYYTVWVYDQRGPKAFPSPGWLMPDSRLVVAMYSTEAYVDRTDAMFCPTCHLGGTRSLRASMVPLLFTFSLAMLTSVIMLSSLL
ncbi:hypothetical protein G6F46_010157 [Rhizopus delemar]|uniref:DUF7137 domain-containing protein n=2 Tax=Rhizopus TaxID=4842 RepID=A0A9P6YVQ1_9FUNG|nr:hypothetical protein G6F55_009204 [Rhizopus delemar]KAG1537709.1 hypothetical protein G6F51_010208 [Rhizopus arrhizus]KAG1491995.1 hypothetical protein G6F54_009624 [Rhizopus delemar]KAG1506143.1 hypothetical protein G6F53_009906 [Rhizopus delemar]KAG1528606.1 hypothetical protein G6F52_000504 [Rhizopus delemar]